MEEVENMTHDDVLDIIKDFPILRSVGEVLVILKKSLGDKQLNFRTLA